MPARYTPSAPAAPPGPLATNVQAPSLRALGAFTSAVVPPAPPFVETAPAAPLEASLLAAALPPEPLSAAGSGGGSPAKPIASSAVSDSTAMWLVKPTLDAA
jgi:hypothetical protein